MKTNSTLRRGALFAAAALLSAVLVSCGDLYSATVQGFVKDADSEQGINGATVYIFQEDPSGLGASAWSSGSVTNTTTATQNNSDGYFSLRYWWSSSEARFWPDADSGSVWFIVTAPDYRDSEPFRRYGILSDGTNTVADILLDRSKFRGPEIRGRVQVNGLGQNGITVTLTYDGEDSEAYSVVSQTVDGDPGTFQFFDPEWDDPDATDGTSSIAASIAVDDANYSAASTNITIQSVDSDTAVHDLPDPLVVNRQNRTQFSTELQGRVFRMLGTENQVGVQGIAIRVEYTSAGPADKVLTTTTGANGQFSVPVNWLDTDPGDFDGEDGTATNDDNNNNPEIPDGEDGLRVTITYTDKSGDDGFDDELGDPTDTFTLLNYDISSHQNPWNLPDVEYAP